MTGIWILIIAWTYRSGVDHIEFNGKFACEQAKSKFESSDITPDFISCVPKDNPETFGPYLPTVCEGIYFPSCHRFIPGQKK